MFLTLVRNTHLPFFILVFCVLLLILLAAWWQQHGINCLELQRLAVRILSQTSSSFGCGHTWSAFDQTLCKRRNRLSQKRLDALVYVHYNLRLKERQLRKKPEDLTSVDSELLENMLDDWVVETESSTFSQDQVCTCEFQIARFSFENFFTSCMETLDWILFLLI